MSKVYVYPVRTYKGKKHQTSHHTGKIIDCWCEPKIIDEGYDDAGERALVFSHSAKQDWRRRKAL